MNRPVRHAFALLFLSISIASAQYTRINVPIGPKDSEGTLHLFLFDSDRTSFKIISQGDSAEPAYKDLDAAMQTHHCEAGCNGGPTDKLGIPLGLVIADGVRHGAPSSESELTSGVLYLDGPRPRLQRAQVFFANPAAQPTQLLQSGPFLVENGKAGNALDTRRIARRTFILTDGDNRWAIGYAPATTLDKLARALADPNTFDDFRVATALCLDGASSSAIWIKHEHGPLYLKEVRGVRNFIGLVKR